LLALKRLCKGQRRGALAYAVRPVKEISVRYALSLNGATQCRARALLIDDVVPHSGEFSTGKWDEKAQAYERSKAEFEQKGERAVGHVRPTPARLRPCAHVSEHFDPRVNTAYRVPDAHASKREHSPAVGERTFVSLHGFLTS
jgi:hypothetical protein